MLKVACGARQLRPLHLRSLRTCLVLLWILAISCGGVFLMLVSRDGGADRLNASAPTLSVNADNFTDSCCSTGYRLTKIVDQPQEEVELLDVDTATLPTESALISVVEKTYPHLALRFWSKKYMYMNSFNRSCALLRKALTAHYNNLHWQTMRTSGGVTFYIYGAYLDDRPLVGYNPLVRLLVMVDSIRPPPVLCQFWYGKRKQPMFSEPATYSYLWRDVWGGYANGSLQPHLVSCAVPLLSRWPPITFDVPDVVSLVERPCQNATNVLRVSNKRPTEGKRAEGIAVCVKGMSLRHDVSVQIVEWLEMLKLLGCRRVFLYELVVHPNISKVLRHYETEGFVDVRRLSLPGTFINVPELYDLFLKQDVNSKRRNEMIPYNDCLYRNLHLYDHLVLLDLDEMIVPTADLYNWPDTMKVMLTRAGGRVASFCARNLYFFNRTSGAEARDQNIPTYMPMLNTVYRSANFTKRNQYVKCFHQVKRVLALHNHYPLLCLSRDRCRVKDVDEGVLRLHHYRKECVHELRATCKRDFSYPVRDTTVWAYKDNLVNNTKTVLRKLGFLKKPMPKLKAPTLHIT